MKKYLTVTSLLLAVCASLSSCGADTDNNEYDDNHIYATEPHRNDHDDRRDTQTDANNMYDDELIETTVVTNETAIVTDRTASDYVNDAVNGVENAGEEIIDGAGNAVGEIIDGAGDAVEDVVDGFDGEPDTTYTEITVTTLDNG